MEEERLRELEAQEEVVVEEEEEEEEEGVRIAATASLRQPKKINEGLV